ncbi:hypothetical protein, partial [Pseudomonas aeruginosa]|uniref:hypothetical protein n=1 Tax=Pseudomonas aeruginosa TaxID=287 RepID=UPI001ABCA2FB
PTVIHPECEWADIGFSSSWETHAGLSSSIPISTGWLIGRYATEIARSGEGKVIEGEVLDEFSFLLFWFFS